MYRLPVLTRLRRHVPITIKPLVTDPSLSGADVLPESPFVDADGVLHWEAITKKPSAAVIDRYAGPSAHPAALQASSGHYLGIIERLTSHPNDGSTDLDRAEQMLELADHCQTLTKGAVEPHALAVIRLNWLGFGIATSQLPQACLALYHQLLAWGVPDQSAIAIFEPGIRYLDDVTDAASEGSNSVSAWVSFSVNDDGDESNPEAIETVRRHLQSVTAGLECVFIVSANLLKHGSAHDPALILDFVYRARHWSRQAREALAGADLSFRWPAHERLTKRLDRLEYAAQSAPAVVPGGFFGLPVSGRLPRIRLNERLSTQYMNGEVSPFFQGDRFHFDAFDPALHLPTEQFLSSDADLLHAVMSSGGRKADFYALGECFYDQLDALKDDGPDAPWAEIQSVMFLRALTCRALALVHQKCVESARDLHTLLTNSIESEEQDSDVSRATALLLFAPLAGVIDEALRVTVDGQEIQLRVWVDAFRSGIPVEQDIARAALQRLRSAWVSLCRLLSDGRPMLTALAGSDGQAELCVWAEDRIEDLLALAEVPDMSFLLGQERYDRGHFLLQARNWYRSAATNISKPTDSSKPSNRGANRSRTTEATPSETTETNVTPAETPLIKVVDGELFDNYADKKSVKENWSLQKAERLKAGLILLPATLDGISTLYDEFPWFREVIEFLELWVARNAALGICDCRLPPLLLVGGYGCGKTYFARRLAEVQKLPFRLLAAGGSSDNRQLAGTSRGWSTAFPALPVDFMAESGVANGLLVIDEIDKESSDRHNGRLSDTLLQLLEPANAKTFSDPFLGCSVDCRHLQWLLTANSLAGINKALLSRVRLFSVEQPRKEHYPRLAQQIRLGFAREYQVDHRLVPHLDGDDLEQIQKLCRSVREVRQATEWMLTRKIVTERRLSAVN